MLDWPSYTIKEASEKTGYNEEYLRRLIREKKIENYLAMLGTIKKYGQYPLKEL